MIRCAVCHREMQGNYNNGQTYYRCRYTAEYAKNTALDLTLTVCVRQGMILPNRTSGSRRPSRPDD